METLIASYPVIMRSTLENLLNLPQQLPDLTREQTLQVLDEMRTSVYSLLNTTGAISKQAGINEALCEERLEYAENQINKDYKDQVDLKQMVAAKEAEIAKYQTELSMTNQQLQAIMNQNTELRKKINDLQQRAEELKKWCWVPGYGQYLAIRTLACDDINRYKQTVEEINRFNMESEQEQVNVQKCQSIINNLNAAVDSFNVRISELQVLIDTLQPQRIEYKDHVTQLSQLQLYLETLDQKLEKITQCIEDVHEVVTYLNSNVSLNSTETGKDEIMLLKDAMIQCSEYIQTVAYVDRISIENHPALPADLKVISLPGSDTSCALPVIKWNGISFWPLSYTDDRLAIAIVAFDELGHTLKRLEYTGSRDIADIKLGLPGDDVVFLGQSKRQIIVPWKELAAANQA